MFGRGGGILPQTVVTNWFKCCRADWAWTAACGMGTYTQDVLQVIHLLMTQSVDAKILNVVAPEKTSQQDFAETLQLGF